MYTGVHAFLFLVYKQYLFVVIVVQKKTFFNLLISLREIRESDRKYFKQEKFPPRKKEIGFMDTLRFVRIARPVIDNHILPRLYTSGD